MNSSTLKTDFSKTFWELYFELQVEFKMHSNIGNNPYIDWGLGLKTCAIYSKRILYELCASISYLDWKCDPISSFKWAFNENL